MTTVDLRAIQTPLKERYRQDASTAVVVTGARSVPFDATDPQQCVAAPTEFPEVQIRSGLHAAAGGTGEVPCSGDILAAALVICEESTIRSVAANMGIALDTVDVEVKIYWDFRGTMGVDRTVPVSATRIEMRSRVKVTEEVNPERAERLLRNAERYCSTLQTLRHGVEVETQFQLD